MRRKKRTVLLNEIGALIVLVGEIIIYPAGALAAECTIEIEGRLVQPQQPQHGKGPVPLVDPRCFVRSSSTATILTIVDARLIEESLGIGAPVLEHTQVRARIPATCSNRGKANLVRDFRTALEITTIRRASSKGLVDSDELQATVSLICGPRSSRIAIQATDYARLVATYPDVPAR